MNEDFPEFDPGFCHAINDGTMDSDHLNELVWSILDYSLDQHCAVCAR